MNGRKKPRAQPAAPWAGEEEDSDDDEDAVAREVMIDRHKPRFGEQAMAPIKVSGFDAESIKRMPRLLSS